MVATTATDDYAVGALSVIGVDDHITADVATLHGDAVVRVLPRPGEPGAVSVFAINRLLADTVRRYDPPTWSVPLWEVTVGEGSNPQDVALCDDVLLVSLYERDVLLVLDPTDGVQLGEVSLAGEVDDDGLPEATGLFVDGGRAWVVLQRLDRNQAWSSSPGGRLVEVDCAARTTGEVWALGSNPQLARGSPPAFVSEDGLRTWRGGEVVSVPVTGLPDGGRIVDAAMAAGDRGAVVVRREAEHAVGCLTGDGAGAYAAVVGAWRTQFVPDVTFAGDEVWFAVRRGWREPSTPGGVLVVDPADCASDAGWVETTWSPYSLDLVPVGVIADDVGAGAAAW